MDTFYDERFRQVDFSGEGAIPLFFSLAKLYSAVHAEYADEAGPGRSFVAGGYTYILQHVEGKDRLTIVAP